VLSTSYGIFTIPTGVGHGNRTCVPDIGHIDHIDHIVHGVSKKAVRGS
jgi:hypothetical protein